MLVPRVQTKQTARPLTVAAPIGGLNGRDGLAAMPPKDAFVLDNWIPGTATVDARPGHSQFVAAASVGGPVESLVAYVGGSVANKKLLAFGNGKIADVTLPLLPAFTSDGTSTTLWTTTSGGVITTTAAGLLRLTNGGGFAAHVFETTPGVNYTVKFDLPNSTVGTVGVSFALIGTTPYGGEIYAASKNVGVGQTFTFTATSATTYIGFTVTGPTVGAYNEYDNIDVTPTAPAALQTGRTGNQIVSTMFSNAGNQFLIGVSGLDVPFSYDGATVTNLVITGLTGSAATLSSVFGFKGRLYFCQKDMLGFYYLGVGNIQGAASYFDLAQVAKKGGYLVAMASFSADSGNGLNDYAVFITSEGEYVVYVGTDPTNAATWSLVARYYSAPPIGRRCAFNYGSELVILTQGGALPFSAIRSEGGVSEDDALTYKLGSFIQDKNLYAGVHGWQAALYPKKGLLFINVPATGSIAGAYVQFVQNTKTKAWTRFTNLNGICWCEFNGDMYFGKNDGRVMKYDTGQLDDGGPILLDCKQAYNYFEDGSGTTNSNKQFHFAKLLLGCDGDPPLNAQFNVDYVEDQPEYVAGVPDTTGSFWDTSTWDLSAWGSDVTTKFFMLSMGKYGVAGSLWVRASLNGLNLKWYATQYVFSKAQGVL